MPVPLSSARYCFRIQQAAFSPTQLFPLPSQFLSALLDRYRALEPLSAVIFHVHQTRVAFVIIDCPVEDDVHLYIDLSVRRCAHLSDAELVNEDETPP